MKRASRNPEPSVSSKHDTELQKAPAYPSFEALEPKLLLAGNIVAVISSAGDLLITGDKNDSGIVISMGPGGDVSVAPKDVNTTVNGAAAAAILSGWTRNIRLRLSDGTDSVQMTGLTVHGNVGFDGGRGDNTLILDSTTVTGKLSVKNLMGTQALSLVNNSTVGSVDAVNAQKGDTTTVVDHSSVTGRLKLNYKDGTDTLTLTASSLGEVKVDNHKGDSTVTMDGCTIGGGLWLRSMQGQDDVDILNATTVGGTMKLSTGDKGATINLVGLMVDKLDIATGKGADVLTFDGVGVSGSSQIKTNKGNDTISIINATVAPAGFDGSVKIDAGDGNDQMDIAAAFGAPVKVNGGKGDDTLNWLTTSTFSSSHTAVQVETET